MEELGYFFIVIALYNVVSYLFFFVLAIIEGSEVNFCDERFRDFLQDLKSDVNHIVADGR